jgi:hypothetical protein
MKFTIGKFDAANRSVPVTFTHNGVRHKRSVNATLTEAGAYDAEATRETVAQVADGVAYKIEIGAITAEAEAG